jgi:hypothetical protein
MADTTDRKAEVLAGLTDGIARLTTSSAWLDWLTFSSRFHPRRQQRPPTTT